MVIPIIDLSRVNFDSLEEDQVEDLVLQQLHDALATVGFIFVTGHSIPQYKVGWCYKLSLQEQVLCQLFKVFVELSSVMAMKPL